eukprot:g2458.t1
MSKVAPDEDLHRCDNDKDDDKATDKDKKEKDGLEGKKKNIREMDSVVDTSNRRVRILQPTASPIYISQDTEGTVACHLFGKRCALNLYKLVDSRMSFLAITCLTVLGLCFLIGDLTAADEVSISVSFVSMLVLPWGFLVFLLLKVKILRLVIKMFNTWFLILQVAAMMVCIGFIVHRPLMITMLSPTLVSTILVDAFPRQHRWKTTRLHGHSIVLMGSSVGIENAYMLKQLLGTFQVWFLLAMSFTAFACVYSTMPDIRLLTSIPISAGLFFSITLDSYPNSGRFLAGCRFYAVKLSMATGIIIMLLVSDTREDYWHYDVGEISFSGAALTISCCINLTIFALRNMFVLLTNRSCLVVLQSLVEYKELSTKPSGTTGGVGGAVAGDGGDDGDESEGGDLKR